MTTLLNVKGLQAFYGETQVLYGLDFSIAEGGVTTLLGANGAGKTTTLRALCNTARSSGSVEFQGVQFNNRSTDEIVRMGIAHVPDGRGTFHSMSTEENLQLGAMTRKDKAGILEDIERMYGYFPILKKRRTQQAGTLSGGEQQMLAVGRALMLRPKLLLLDEPSFGLAPLVVRELFEILGEVNKKERVSILLVEQNASLALGLADHAYLIETGRIVMSGPSSVIREDESVRRSYLGY
jgi:branched-chain amino acid transport system ATP-binding protein